MAADEPWGPWNAGSQDVQVFGSGSNPNHYQMYAPAVMTKWSDNDAGRYVVLLYTGRGQGFGNILQAVNVVSGANEFSCEYFL